MMNAFFKSIDWNNIKYIGFDLDGTLYDEIEFIKQVYKSISENLFTYNEEIYFFMLKRWVEKGSSYPYIFKETFEKYKKYSLFSENEFISKALYIYRNFYPDLVLNYRTEIILNYCRKNYKIFLISDGNYNLQKNKFKALNLDKYFDSVYFTGKYGSEFYKPNTKILEKIDFDFNPKETVFFGDRVQDKEFAMKSGMNFIQVYNMIKVR